MTNLLETLGSARPLGVAYSLWVVAGCWLLVAGCLRFVACRLPQLEATDTLLQSKLPKQLPDPSPYQSPVPGHFYICRFPSYPSVPPRPREPISSCVGPQEAARGRSVHCCRRRTDRHLLLLSAPPPSPSKERQAVQACATVYTQLPEGRARAPRGRLGDVGVV